MMGRPGAGGEETVATVAGRCYTRGMMRSLTEPVARRAVGGLTILEVFLAIAIIFIVFTLFISSGSQSAQQKRMAVCQANLQTIYAALNTFAQDNQGTLPVLDGAQTSEAPLSLLVPKYTTGTEVFICPGGKDKPLPEAQPFADRKISYAYYQGQLLAGGGAAPLMSDAQVNTARKSRGQQIFSLDGKKPGNNHHKFGGNFLFGDGNVQYTTAYLAFDLTLASNAVLLNPKP